MVYGARPYGSRGYADSTGNAGNVVAAPTTSGSVTFSGVASMTTAAMIAKQGATVLNGVATMATVSSQQVKARVSFAGSSSFLARRFSAPTALAGSQRIQYQVIVVDVNGTRYADLEQADLQSVTWELNGIGGATFTIPILDAKASVIQVPNREAQIWRGGQLIWWGVIVKTTKDNAIMTVQCAGLMWYFKKRLVGKADRTNYILNGSFENNLAHWSIGAWHSSETAAGRNPATWTYSQSEEHSIIGNRSLYLEQLDPTYPVQSIAAQQSFTQTAPGGIYPKGIVMTLAGWCFIPSNKYRKPSGFRQGLVLSRFSSTETVTVTGGDGSVATFPKHIADNIIEITDSTPKDTVLRFEVNVTQPPGTTEIIQARLHCPNGAIWWDEITLTYDEKLSFYDVDQALIVKGLIEHAQSVTFEKSSLNIGTNCPLTGIRRTREYVHAEHELISDSLDEFPSLHQGMDIEIEITPTTRTATTYYPRKGNRRPDMVLELGRNIVSFTIDEDGESTANSIVVLGFGEGSDREEGGAQDTSTMAGLVLEKVYNATPGSNIKTLDEQAQRGVQRFKSPVVIPQVTTHEGAGALIGNLRTGDVVPVRINHGRAVLNDDFRIVSITLDPKTDQLTYTLNPAATVF